MSIILQEVSGEAQHEIPAEVREAYRIWRPTPLMRAERFEQALGLKGVRIYYKYEGVSPSGSHKPNTAVPQAFYCAQDGRKRIATETGAGQWGSSLAYATQLYGLECEVFMVGISYRQKPYRRIMMETFGGTVHSSPSNVTHAGRTALEADPDSLGSLGLAISEAVERAATDPEAAYSLGSVLNHVLMHQTVIGLEAKEQLAAFGEKGPDVVIGCAGGGSNFAGISFPFLRDKIAGADIEVIAVEPASCPTLTRGVYAYDFGDAVGMAPLVPMHTLGHDFMPPGIHAGGLRYHGMAPLVSHAMNQGLHPGRGLRAARLLRRRHPVREGRGHPARARADARDQGRDRGGAPRRGERQGAGHPLQPVRARALRHAGLRRLPQRPPAGSRDARGRARPRARRDRGLPEGTCTSPSAVAARSGPGTSVRAWPRSAQRPIVARHEQTNTMQAVIVRSFGGTEVLEVADAADPRARAGARCGSPSRRPPSTPPTSRRAQASSPAPA